MRGKLSFCRVLLMKLARKTVKVKINTFGSRTTHRIIGDLLGRRPISASYLAVVPAERDPRA